MPIISVTDNENNGLKRNIEKSTQTNTQKTKRTRGDRSYSEKLGAK